MPFNILEARYCQSFPAVSVNVPQSCDRPPGAAEQFGNPQQPRTILMPQGRKGDD